jgi:hypothetical protein
VKKDVIVELELLFVYNSAVTEIESGGREMSEDISKD